MNAENVEKVRELQAKQKRRGYKPGWVFHKCREKGLLSEFMYLQQQERAKVHEGAPRRTLTIELVPEACWFSNVRSEVTLQQWDMLKKNTAAAAGNRCQVCYGRGPKWPVECHEIWHYDDRNLIQELKGLIALCPSCHEVKHMGLANVRGRADIAMAHLAAVNQWSKEQTEQYVQKQFDIWLERSRYDWQLDISWLRREYGIVVGSPVRENQVVQVDSQEPEKATTERLWPRITQLVSRILPSFS